MPDADPTVQGFPLDLPTFMRIGPLDWAVRWEADPTQLGGIDYAAQSITLPMEDTPQRATTRLLHYIVAALVDMIDADPSDYYGVQCYTAHIAAGVHAALRDAPALLRAMLPDPVVDPEGEYRAMAEDVCRPVPYPHAKAVLYAHGDAGP